MITIEAFREALDDLGIRNKISGKSLAVHDCPSCGNSEFKVLFDRYRIKKRERRPDEPFVGRCFKASCGTNYSSISYLIAAGMAPAKALGLHGRSFEQAMADILQKQPALQLLKIDPVIEIKKVGPVNTKGFLPLGCWPEHPADQYTVGRGGVKELPNIMIDPKSNAAVFVVLKDGEAIGFQKRFVNPTNPKFKTWTMPGFDKSSNILEFPRDGKDILICEGPFTALAAWHYGYHAICTFGAQVSDQQLLMIMERVAGTERRIGVSFDIDKAGRKGLDKIRRYLHWTGIEPFVVKPNGGQNDLNDAWMTGTGVSELTPNWPEIAIPTLYVEDLL